MNSFHQGIPSITVVVDGGWSKQSDKHSYNARVELLYSLGDIPENYYSYE